jgi:hypothetical protein
VNKLKYLIPQPDKNILSILYEDGILDLVKLSDSLCENKWDEVSKINRLINNLLN